MRYNLLISFACLSLVTGPAPGLGQQRNDRTDPPEIGDRTDDRPAKGIQDNSFLIEEAYNQEPGVVQAITAFRGQGSSRSLAFVHEFPLWSQTHQFSYSVPYSLRGESRRVRGVGDVLLNYRYQALFESDTSPAFAPRISLVLPTGSTTNDTGSGSFGLQGNLPISKVVTDRITLHANAGVTSLFDVQGRTPVSFNVGGSAVYAVTRDLNVLFEAVGERIESVSALRRLERDYVLTLSPGARYAINLPDTQIVVGAGAPIAFARNERPSYGAILYLSVESKLFQ